MLAFLRRRQPHHPALAVLYWLAILVVTVAILFTLFFLFEDYLPGTDPGRVGSVSGS
jgi:hypothetical protein